MKISYQWLLEYVALAVPPAELREALSAVGLVVESIQSIEEDTVLDVEIPSNRPDCLSHIGIARELAAIYDCDLRVPGAGIPGGSQHVSVRIESPELCRRYSARVVRGVRIGDSVGWIRKRLLAVGQRPINNIVDITNYVLMERGHPLHAFDLNRLQGPEIIVRRAHRGEMLRTLDGIDRLLNEENLVIADARVPVALAGVMGGEGSEVSSSSADLLIESAYFDPVSVGKTARALQLRTEASHRFERGADPNGTIAALERCVELILKLGGGVPDTPVIDLFPDPWTPLGVSLRRKRLKDYSLLDIPDSFVRRTLSRLEFHAQENQEGWRVTIPSHRVDVSCEEDLIEELLRHYGYDKIPSTLPRWRGKGGLLPERERRGSVSDLLRSVGYSETLNWTLMDPDLEKAFGYEDACVTLKNPLSADASQLRTHLAPNLVLAARHNWNHGEESVRLFEVGQTFARDAGRVVQREHVAWVALGVETRKYWHHETDPLNYFYVKGVLNSLVRGAVLSEPEFRPADAKFLNPVQSAEIYREGQRIGYVGNLHPDLQESLKIKDPLFLGEINLSAAGQPAGSRPLYKPLTRYPGVFRDLSFLVDRSVPFEALTRFVWNESVPNLNRLELIDLYDSPQLPPGKISLAIRFFFESTERTLTDEEAEEARARIVQGLKTEFGIIPR